MSPPTLPMDVENNIVNLPNTVIHPFGEIQESSSQASSKFTERTPLITPPPTVWTKFNARFRFGKCILVAAGACGIFIVMFIVIGTLGVFKNTRYRAEAGISIGTTKYPGNSSGAWANNDMSGQGDGTYYGKHISSFEDDLLFILYVDPGVGLTACGTQFTSEDYIVAMVTLINRNLLYANILCRMNMILGNLIIQTIVPLVVSVS